MDDMSCDKAVVVVSFLVDVVGKPKQEVSEVSESNLRSRV